VPSFFFLLFGSVQAENIFHVSLERSETSGTAENWISILCKNILKWEKYLWSRFKTKK